jgi:hypothetical protein
MKQHMRPFLLGISLLGLLQACYKDKGNYDLVDYNAITSITATTSSVILGDTLRIRPIIKWKYPNRDTLAFEYEWRQVDSVVSRERNLAFAPNVGGYVMFFLYVKEKATGIVSRFAVQVQIISGYKAGWLLLTNQGGKSGLSYIRRDAKKDANNVTYYEYKYFPDVYAKAFPDLPLGDNPMKLATRAFPDYSLDEVLVMQGSGSVYLNGDNFAKRIRLASEFPTQQFPHGAQPIDYVDGGPANWLLMNDGNVYWKRNQKIMGGIHDGNFLDVPLYFEGGGAKITRFIEASYDQSGFVYIYDDLKKRFVGLFTTTGSTDYNGNKMFLTNATTPPAGWVELNNMTGFTMLYSSDHSNGVYYMNIIKNNSTGQYLLQNYRLTMAYSSVDVSEHQQEVFAGGPYITDNTVFYRIRNSSYLFFGEGSKLYFYDINTKKVTLYHDFGSGIISKITSDANSGELGVALTSGGFHVLSLKNDVLGNPNPGSVGMLFSVPNVGVVVDLTWKWGSYFDYVFRRYPG